MIKELRLQNFRGFKDHRVNLKSLSILVGKNNAGKSTIVEALRLVSIITNRYAAINFHDVPKWLDIPIYKRGVSPALEGLEINFINMFHKYSNPPAKLTVTFSTNEVIEIYLGKDGKIHALLYDSKGRLIDNKSKALRIDIPKVEILPQIGPLALKEYVLVEKYVKRAMSSALSSIHFRNQLNIYYKEFFSRFKKQSEESWYGLQIRDLQGKGSLPGEKNELNLMVRDGDFVAEVGWMGHGLQMWLQIMWFLTLSQGSGTVILDEPDVYMHADLQRRLIKLLKNKFPQVIITTHSVEIMSEVEADDILVVDKTDLNSQFANSLPDVQRVVNQIGSVHNIQLARLWSAKHFILVEGEDIGILRYFQNIIVPNTELPLDIIPSMSIGGWGGWNYVTNSPMYLKNSKGEEIITYCILDRDYYTNEEIEKRINEAKKANIQLYVWQKKEIENYLLVPDVITRALNAKLSKEDIPIDVTKVEEVLNMIAETLKDRVFDLLSSELYRQNKAAGVPKANEQARGILNESWKTLNGRLSITPGTEVLPLLLKFIQDNYRVSLSKSFIAQYFNPSEIPKEVTFLLHIIEDNEKFY